MVVVAVAVSFDFTNGFHDTANAVATSIATGALKPMVAVIMSGCLNFLGAFISISVAATIAKGIVDPAVASSAGGLEIVLAALIGAIIWNLTTWCLSIPSSSSHAIIGGLIGASIAAVGSHAVNFHGILQKVVAPAILAVLICGAVAALGTFAAYVMVRRLGDRQARTGYRYGQIGSAALVSLAHGTNDAQKTMGIIALALISTGHIDPNHFYVPFWVKLVCALGDLARDRHRRLADHQHDGQPDHVDRVAAGVRRRGGQRIGDPRVLLLRLPAVDHPGRLRRRHRRRDSARSSPCTGTCSDRWCPPGSSRSRRPGSSPPAPGRSPTSSATTATSAAIVIVAITIVIARRAVDHRRRTAVTAKDLDRTNVTPEEEAEGAFERAAGAPAAA